MVLSLIHIFTIRINKEVKNKLKNITFHQLADKKLKSIIESVQRNPNHQLNDKYTWYKNKLYGKDRGAWKLMLTAELSRTLIYELHNAYSHIRNRRTYQLFKEYFTGDSINKITQHVIKTCQTCQKSKDYYQRMLGETQPVIPKSKGELVSIDYYGPLPTSTGGVKYILIMVDNFTKFVKLYQLKRATTTVTINKIKLYCEEIGKPVAILSDNGTQFTSQKWKNTLQELHIKPKFTAVRNPCTNLAERINQQLGNMLRALTLSLIHI